MIDWDKLVIGPTAAVFGEPVKYWPSSKSPVFSPTGFDIVGTFHEAYQSVGTLSDPGVISTHPALGVQVSQFPGQFDSEQAQGDRFMVLRTGKIYIVKAGHRDGLGAARLDAMVAP